MARFICFRNLNEKAGSNPKVWIDAERIIAMTRDRGDLTIYLPDGLNFLVDWEDANQRLGMESSSMPPAKEQ